MEDEKIIQTISKLFAGADNRNWQQVEDTMASTVLLDYTSMAGGSPSEQTPKQISDAWAAFLPGFDRTHHALSGFNVQVTNAVAHAHYEGKADHFIGPAVWTVEGSYETELKKVNGTWLITRQKFNFTKQSGDTTLPGLATERVKKKS